MKETIAYLNKVIHLYNNQQSQKSISNLTPDVVHHTTKPVQVKRIWKNY